MTTWELFKEIIKTVGFYKRKFFLFVLIFVVALSTYFVWRSTSYPAAEVKYEGKLTEAFSSQVQTDIIIDKNGGVLIDGQKNNGALRFYKDYDELRIMVFDNPTEFISYFRGTIHLPAEVKESDLTQIVYAVHGVGNYLTYMSNSKTLVYEASDISPGATLTIVARLPKGLVKAPFFKGLSFQLSELTVNAWLDIAIVLPVITLIVMTFMFLRRRSGAMFTPKGLLSAPPEEIPPALSGVLVDGTVGAREIASTLIDLAQRGYIMIINKGDGNFTFGKRKLADPRTTEGLSDYERALLSKIFMPTSIKSTVGDVEMRIGRHIFSRKIANFYLGIYNQATSRGYFVKNPTKVHLAYKYTGIGLFFLSFLGLLYGAISNMDPKYSLLFYVGGMISAALIIKFAPFMPARTKRGSFELKQWLSFREYLSAPGPVPAPDFLQNKYDKYLPYAIVLGSEVDWTKRFLDQPFKQPDWYDSREQIVTLESFANNFFPFIGFVSENLAKSHDPSVE